MVTLIASWHAMSHHVYMAEQKNDRFRDRALLGEVVGREIRRAYRTVTAFQDATKVSRKTVERIQNADPSVERESIEFIEGRLGFPRDTFQLIAQHDVQGLREIGVDPDLVRWVSQKIAKNDGTSTADVTAAI